MNLCCSSRCSALLVKAEAFQMHLVALYWKSRTETEDDQKHDMKEGIVLLLVLTEDFILNCSLLSSYSLISSWIAEYYLLIWRGAFEILDFNVTLSI